MTLEFIRENWLKCGDHRYGYRVPFPTHRIMVVASVHLGPNLWAAYIDAVPGHSHDAEWSEVAAYGGKLCKEDARRVFPNMPEELTYRD